MKALRKAQQFQEDMIRCRGINASANLDVLFSNQLKYGKRNHNCHPTWKVKYFDENGTLIAHFDENECVFRPERPAA